jgi:hypothetical protein
MRMDDLGSYGVGRFQLASNTAETLEVVTPADVDRGPWPLPVRSLAAILAGLAAWLGTRSAIAGRSGPARAASCRGGR